MIGQTLGHYRIEMKLGEGGMGVVYKAHDTHLDRSVAIKILPHDRVADAERKRRFVQEAKAASALNHPNILHIYDVDSADGVDFIAMEYVEGKTLDQLIGRKGLQLSDALKYAAQVAEALAAAHRARIVHRDVKPSNIVVTETGLVKILDFGLAKLTERLEWDPYGPTETVPPHTAEGTIVGTAAYMSPEQAEGKTVDARSDIFSFGSVLYEMVTGRRAFQGATQVATWSAILRDEPASLPEGTPPELEKLIARCLRKEPQRRIQHIGDVKLALDELKEEFDSGRLTAAIVERHQPRWKRAWILAALALVAAIGFGVVWILRPASEVPAAPLRTIPLTSYPGSEEYPSLAPDGNQVAFSWDRDGQNTDIYVQPVGPGTPLRLTNHPAADVSPAWSPDGRWIAFVRTPRGMMQLILIPPLGGPERVLAEMNTIRRIPGPHLAWTPDGKWLAGSCEETSDQPPGLCLFSIESAERRRLTSPPARTVADTSPTFSPDGRGMTFNRGLSTTTSDLYVLRLTSSLTPDGDPRKLTPESQEIYGAAWTGDGRSIVYSVGDGLLRVSANGSADPQRLPFAGDGARYPTISESRKRLVYSLGFTDGNIWRIELAGPREAVSRRLVIASSRTDGRADYSSDGKRITFHSNRSGSMEIWACQNDGTNCVQLTTLHRPGTFNPRWSPDGKYIVFDSRDEAGQGDVYVVDADGRKTERLTADAASDSYGSWSRDNRWIYFTSLRTGQYQIWKMPWIAGASREGEAVQVTKNGGYTAIESADGFVYYANPRNNPALWRISVRGGEESQVVPALYHANAFAVRDSGIYFIPPRNANGTYSIEFLEFASGKTFEVASIDKPVGERLALSPDGRSLLYGQIDQQGRDLMLVENFR